MTWMIYGANGYTGRLTAEAAVAGGLRPVLAGRSGRPIAVLARRLGLEYRVVDLDGDLAGALAGIDAVAHCAGPFAVTSAPMIEACLATGTHYLDITGEVAVLEAAYARHEEAVAAGVVLLPGAGFDVVPTDCLAGMVAAAVPGAESLEIAFSATGGISPGTTKTMIDSGGVRMRRVDGRLVSDGGARARRVPFPSGSSVVVPIVWGDLASAFRSTGVPTITTYVRPSAGLTALAPIAALVGRAPGTLRGVGRSVVGALATGPGRRRRARTGCEVWARARDSGGASASVTMIGPNVYSLTVDSLIRAVERVAAGELSGGAYTPATAFGVDYVSELDGVTVCSVRRSPVGPV